MARRCGCSGTISPGATATVVPTTGQTVTIASGTRTELINPAGTLASLTITLPETTTSFDNTVEVITTQALTALTVNAAGSSTVAGMPTTLAANGFFRAKLIAGVWRRV